MKRIIISAILLVSALFSLQAQNAEAWKSIEKEINLYIANDLGRNGYYDQKPIAELMGEMAETIDIECVLAAGDVHHFEGVRSINDPLWMTNYELIYKHPELMIPWHPVLGNHEYRSCTQAVIDYSNVSARWRMPARYYSMTLENDGVSILIVMIDTTPLISKYREESYKYPDASRESAEKQMEWLDKTLAGSDADWKIVVGHHPIYAHTTKDECEREDMKAAVDPILKKHIVDMDICGHIHYFQHLMSTGCAID